MDYIGFEVIFFHFLGKLRYCLRSIAKDQCLSDVEIPPQVQHHTYFPLFSLYGNVVLLDIFKVVFDYNRAWIVHIKVGEIDYLC